MREYLSEILLLLRSDKSKEELEKFFDLTTDWDWIVYIFVKTKEWDFSMGYTTDIDLADLQNVINYLKFKADIYLR